MRCENFGEKSSALGLRPTYKTRRRQVHSQQQPHEFDKIYDAVMRLKYGDQRPSAGNGSDDPAAGAGGDQEGSPPPLADGDDGQLN